MASQEWQTRAVMNNRNETIEKLYTVFVDTTILGFLRKGKCFWTTQDSFGMLPHDGELLTEIDPDNLFPVEVRGQLNFLFKIAHTPLSDIS